MFMFAMAQVLGDVLLAVELERRDVRALPAASRLSSRTISHLMSRPPEPQQGS